MESKAILLLLFSIPASHASSFVVYFKCTPKRRLVLVQRCRDSTRSRIAKSWIRIPNRRFTFTVEPAGNPMMDYIAWTLWPKRCGGIGQSKTADRCAITARQRSLKMARSIACFQSHAYARKHTQTHTRRHTHADTHSDAHTHAAGTHSHNIYISRLFPGDFPPVYSPR